MCGIAGFVEKSWPDEEARTRLGAMLRLIAHRGPDGEGAHVSGGVAIGMRRLSIIDLAGGAQPIWNEDETIGVVFNGEIYNYVELRAQLETKGHRFRTRCDTEVLVHLFEEEGEMLVRRLRGMFAFAIFDLRKRTLFLARDHFGQKPLYYFAGDGRFAFASELKCLLALPFVPRELDPEALLDFATWLSLPPPRTHFRHIRKLPAGSHLTVALDSAAVAEPARYWRFSMTRPVETTDLERAIECIDDALSESIRLHFRADVPVGVLLSSGLDSRTVAAYSRHLHPEGISTFSVGYAEEGSELEGARITAREVGTDHHELSITGAEIGKWIDHLAWHLDEPIGDPAVFAVWQVCKFAREHVKVLLSGEGADELFAGYDFKYRSHIATLERSDSIRRFAGWLPDTSNPFPSTRLGRLRRRAHISQAAEIVALRTQAFPGDQRRPRGLTREQLLRLRRSEAEIGRELVRPQRDLLSTLLAFDVDWMLGESLLQKADKMSMAASIELRTP
ncbi:MAG TPA: asparagine synthase (glutamine-hydrolyzing), partial [Chthoniobacteraceae bacterium]|nr:asparagine synthase (glutamine-hydrolyzing) [Chthoniobacteraceae bacterium]